MAKAEVVKLVRDNVAGHPPLSSQCLAHCVWGGTPEAIAEAGHQELLTGGLPQEIITNQNIVNGFVRLQQVQEPIDLTEGRDQLNKGRIGAVELFHLEKAFDAFVVVLGSFERSSARVGSSAFLQRRGAWRCLSVSATSKTA